MDQDELNFARVIFASVLAMQYHPRNDVLPENDDVVIGRCLSVTYKALYSFRDLFHREED